MEMRINEVLECYILAIKEKSINTCDAGFDAVKTLFSNEVEKRKSIMEKCSEQLENAFDFMKTLFREGQEMVVFVTELNSGYFSIKFINKNGCYKFYQNNKRQ